MSSLQACSKVRISKEIDSLKDEIIKDSILQVAKDSFYVSEDPNVSAVDKPVTMQEVLQEKKLLSGDYTESDPIFFLEKPTPPKGRVLSNCYSCENTIKGKNVNW
jgi:hypothetical protein